MGGQNGAGEAMSQISPQLRETDGLPYFSSPSICPTLISGAESFTSSPIDDMDGRRPSASTSELSLVGSAHNTRQRSSLSPETPVSPAEVLDLISREPSMTMTMSDLFRPEDVSNMAGHYPGAMCELVEPDRTPRYCQVPMAASDQTISPSIFPPRRSEVPATPHMSSWRPGLPQTPPKTVAPSLTMQATLPTSPASAFSTPSMHRRHDGAFVKNTVNILATPSSPTYRMSDPTCLADFHRFGPDLQPTLVRTIRSRATPAGRSRVRARESQGATSRQDPRRNMCHSGIKIPCIVEMARHSCTVPGCDKRFKRREHRKRHEKTCHTGEKPYVCWVEKCERAFSRTDNLNSHLFKTHGKKSPAARNNYVATLDSSTAVFDPDFRGPFDEDGWPIQRA